MASAVSWAASPSRSLTTTLAPCSDSSSAVALPMPRALPVTIATLSSRTPMHVSLSGCQETGDPIGLLANQSALPAVAQRGHDRDGDDDRGAAHEPRPAVVPA